jgi:hypothetical protein
VLCNAAAVHLTVLSPAEELYCSLHSYRDGHASQEQQLQSRQTAAWWKGAMGPKMTRFFGSGEYCALGVIRFSVHLNVSTPHSVQAECLPGSLRAVTYIAHCQEAPIKEQEHSQKREQEAKGSQAQANLCKHGAAVAAVTSVAAEGANPFLATVLSSDVGERTAAYTTTSLLTSLIVQPSSSRKHGCPAGGEPPAPACCPTLCARTDLTS